MKEKMISPLAVNRLLEEAGFKSAPFRNEGVNVYHRGSWTLHIPVDPLPITDTQKLFGIAHACGTTIVDVQKRLLRMMKAEDPANERSHILTEPELKGAIDATRKALDLLEFALARGNTPPRIPMI